MNIYKIGTSTFPGGRIPQRARMATRACLCGIIFGSLSMPVKAEYSCPAPSIDSTAYIKYIHDGDTLRLRDGRKVRLIGINTPELARDNKPAELYANEAKDALRSLFKDNKSISLVYGKDKKDHYGRILAHVFLPDGQNVQATLLKQGFASAIMQPPNTGFSACYLEMEKDARCNNRGIWEQQPVIEAKKLQKRDLGFHHVRGRVVDIDNNRKGIWLNIDDKLTIGIRTENLPLFEEKEINNYLNKSITVRGWLNKSNRSNPFYMRIRHPLSIQLSSTYTCH